MKLPLCISSLLVVVFLFAVPKESEESLRVAVFDFDVTPPVGSAMAYTKVEKEPELSLRCRGVVLMGAGDPIVLCAIDWIGVANEGYDAFRDSLARAAGTTRERVTLHALHQHDAPGCDFTAEKLVKEYGLKGYERLDGKFHREVIKRASLEIKEAIPKAQKVTHYGWGEAAVEKVASNRRLLGPDGKVRAVRFTATKDPALRAEPEGVIDPEVSLLSFWNETKPVAVLSYYACHPQSYYRTGTPSPDFPGIARFMRGQGVPEALHVHFNGAGGDLGAGKYNDGNPENRIRLANRLAEGMAKAWRSTKKRALTAEAIGLQVEKVRLPLADHLKDEDAFVEAVKEQKARGYFANIDQLAYARQWRSGKEIDVSCLAIGDTRVLHMPGELFVEYQLAAKKMRPDLKVAMAAYGEYGTGYIGTEISYSQGGYETSPTASAVGPGSEKILMAAMKKLLGEKPKKEAGRVAPKSPKEAIADFEVPPDFEVQLVASEPQIQEPIVVTYDENGLMYAAEYLKFPAHHGKSDGPDGRIRLLRDEDGNGHYERSEVFADGIAWPTGICCYEGGIYVVAAPDLWYFKDSDGDGIAEVREKVFTGFGFRNDEGTANNLFWGLDHWIYGAGSNSGGEIVNLTNKKAKPVSIRGRDFRFHPKTREFQSLSGGEQFGNTMDDWGNRFICQNSKPAVQVVLPISALEGNPHLPIPNAKKNLWEDAVIYRSSGIESWRTARTKLRLSGKRKFPAPSVAHDVFSGCSGVTVYRGTVYPEVYHGNLFVGDVQGNLLHRRTLKSEGLAFSCERAETKGEFLRTRDNWFRPVNLTNAPDGTLHLVDMYRETIETPDSMVPEILEMVDFRAGHELGRIYRIAPKGFQPPPPPSLGEASIAELVKELENPNAWWRDTAGRLLVERGGGEALPLLRKMLRESECALSRLHALSVLDGLESLGERDLEMTLNDPSPRVREHALGRYQSKFPALRKRVIALADDDSIRVRFQAALVLGRLEGDDVVQALVKIALRDESNPWMRAVVLRAQPSLAIWLFAGIHHQRESPHSWMGPLVVTIGARNKPDEVKSLIKRLHKGMNLPVVELSSRLNEGLKQAGGSLSDYTGGEELLGIPYLRAQARLLNQDLGEGERLEQIGVLGRTSEQSVAPVLYELLDSAQSPKVQTAALWVISGIGEEKSSEKLIAALPKLSPAVQNEIVGALLGREGWTMALLQAVKAGEISLGRIPLVHQQRLLKHESEEVKNLSGELFSAEATPRGMVVKSYQAALKLEGSIERGREVFSKHCMSCHQVGKIGFEVGPTLSTVKARSPESILVQILDPNRELLANFVQFFVTRKDGRVATGRIVRESESSLTLRRAGGVEETVFRKDIKTITSSERSLMPDGLEEVIDHQAMSDLIAFLRGGQ